MTEKQIKTVQEFIDRLYNANCEFLEEVKDLDINPLRVILIMNEAWVGGLEGLKAKHNVPDE